MFLLEKNIFLLDTKVNRDAFLIYLVLYNIDLLYKVNNNLIQAVGMK